jgi:hypothetical protein
MRRKTPRRTDRVEVVIFPAARSGGQAGFTGAARGIEDPAAYEPPTERTPVIDASPAHD